MNIKQTEIKLATYVSTTIPHAIRRETENCLSTILKLRGDSNQISLRLKEDFRIKEDLRKSMEIELESIEMLIPQEVG